MLKERSVETDHANQAKPSVRKPWLKYFTEEALNSEFPHHTLYSYLKEVNGSRLDDVALHYYGTGIKYRQFFANIDECANSLAALGVKAGDVVSFLTVSVPETIMAVYATNKLGATVNAIDPRMDVDSIRRMVIESGSRVLIMLDIVFPKVLRIKDDINQDKIIVQSAARSLPPVKKIFKTLTTKTQVIYGADVIKWDQFLALGKNTVAKEAPYKGDAAAVITYTGGTTGFPKGVILTNDNMNANVVNFKYSGLDYKRNERFLGIIPVFTSYGIVCGLHMPLCIGLQMVLVPAFSAASFAKLIKEFKPNHLIGVPAFHELLMESKLLKNMDLSFLVTLASGGDTMNEGLEKRLHDFMKEHNMKYPLAQGYGMSEVAAAASFCINKVYKPASVGVPSLHTTIGIFKPDTFEELDCNQEGEVCITGPTMMAGYYKRPEETAHVMREHPDGTVWIHSGDIGYMDEDGFLFIQGRVKRMITRFDGHKIFPVNIESLVGSLPMVRNCCAFAVKDREHGQGNHPLVAVTLIEGDQKELCQQIYDLCQEKLEERGRPVGIIALDDIPLTSVGKNDYRSLEKQYGQFDYRTLGQAK